jgi:oligogalacturonide lyase
VHGSLDRRWGVGADFAHNIYLIDRTNDELIPHSTSHRPSEQDHPHPTFSPDGTKIQIQPAMLTEDGRSMNLVVIRNPEHLLERTYSDRLVP